MIDVDKINIWRFNIHTYQNEDAEGNKVDQHLKSFNYCESKSIIGTGWVDVPVFKNDFNENLKKYNKPDIKSFKQAMNALKNIKLNDIIWTRKNNTYYVCRVTGIAQDMTEEIDPNKEYKNGNIDVGHFVKCEFYKVGAEDKIPGIIIKSFNQGIICHISCSGDGKLIRYIKNFSANIINVNNKKTNKKIYQLDEDWDNINDFNVILGRLTPLEIEELVGLYLQIIKNYGIYTSTNRKDTKEYEFILFNRDDGHLAKLQVKTNDSINLENYDWKDNKYKYYFYSTDESCTKALQNEVKNNKIENVEIITNDNLLELKNHIEILPEKYKNLFGKI